MEPTPFQKESASALTPPAAQAHEPPWTLADFDYDLPAELVAQTPTRERDQARLLLLERTSESIRHQHVHDLPQLLRSGDLLILNNTRVMPARLFGRRQRTDGKWEGLFLRADDQGRWELLSQTRGRLNAGEIIVINGGDLSLEFIEKTADHHWLAQPSLREPAHTLLEKYGHVPIPPYIRRGCDEPADRDRYQTVFAERSGAVAAPTAGLHFTAALLHNLKESGIDISYVTLHVGLGTFQPVQAERIAEHKMHREWGELSAATVNAIELCRERGGRVVAVGTTSVRVLESAAAGGALQAWSGETDLFIYPPYRFRVVDALLTNFHWPRSSLLMLVSAFAGVERIRRAYNIAVEEGYRFYSYGDAMLIL